MTARRAVLFDVAGTLVDAPAPTPGAHLAEALGDAELAAAIDAIALRLPFGSPGELAARLAAELGLGAEPSAAVNALWDAAAAPAVEGEGATTCVAALHATGASVGIVANLWTPALAGFRAGCPALAAEIDGWFASCEHGSVKPSAAILHAALVAFDVKPADVLVIGDDLAQDVVPAVALGMSAVWLRCDDARGGVVPVDPHAAPFPVPADVVPQGATIARSLSEVRRIALTWLWSARGGRAALTGPLPL